MLVGFFGHLPFLSSALLVHTFKTLKRKTSYRIAQHEVLGRKPVIEGVGPALDTIVFTMRLDTTLGIMPLKSVEILRQYVQLQESHPLIIGTQYIGNFNMTDFDDEWKFFGPTGSPRVIEVSVNLTESGHEWLNDTVVTVSNGFKSGGGLNALGNVVSGL